MVDIGSDVLHQRSVCRDYLSQVDTHFKGKNMAVITQQARFAIATKNGPLQGQAQLPTRRAAGERKGQMTCGYDGPGGDALIRDHSEFMVRAPPGSARNHQG